MNKKRIREDAIERLIQKLIKKEDLPQAITASGLREVPGLKKDEKISLIKKVIIKPWKRHLASCSEDSKPIRGRISKYTTTDELMDFALDNIRDIGYDEIADTIKAFGASDEIILRFAILMREHDIDAVSQVLEAVKNHEISKVTIEYIVKWAIETSDTDSAIIASGLREKPGLTPAEVEILIEKRKTKSDLITCIILANMRENPGLTSRDIEDLAAN